MLITAFQTGKPAGVNSRIGSHRMTKDFQKSGGWQQGTMLITAFRTGKPLEANRQRVIFAGALRLGAH